MYGAMLDVHHQLVVYFGGVKLQPKNVNTIDYVTISTLGNAADFGDLTTTWKSNFACMFKCNSWFVSGGYYNGIVNKCH